MAWRPYPLLTSCALLALTGNGAAWADGAELYAAHCAACHQPDGNGAEGLAPPLAGVLGKLAGTVGGRKYLAQVVASGMVGKIASRGVEYNGNMPAAPLTDDEMSSVMGFVLSSFNAGAQEIPAALFAEARDRRLQPSAVRRLRERILEQVGE